MNADAMSITSGQPAVCLELDRLIGKKYAHTKGTVFCPCGSVAHWEVGSRRIYVECSRAGCAAYSGRYEPSKREPSQRVQERLL